MGQSILLVLARGDEPSFFIERIRSSGAERIQLCPIDYPSQKTAVRIQERLGSKDIKLSTVDFVKEFNQKAFEVKDQYIDFIHNVGEAKVAGGKSLKEFFIYPGESFSLWWFSLIAEKNPCKGESYNLFCKILTLLHLKKKHQCDHIWISHHAHLIDEILKESGEAEAFTKTSFSGTVLKEQLRAIKFIIELSKRVLDVARLKSDTADKMKDCDVSFVTMFPYIDEYKLKEEKFVNLAYGAFQEAFEKHHPKKISWLGAYSGINSYTWEKSVEVAAQIKKREVFSLKEEWISLADVFGIFWMYLRISLRTLFSLNSFKTIFYFKDPVSQKQINLWKIFEDDLISSFMGKALIWGLADYQIFSNYAQALMPNTKLFYFAEMHGWEKALNLACHKKGGITTFGLQHTIVPLLLLNYFESPKDIKGEDWVRYAPTPDYLGCVGEQTRKLFEDNGWPKEKLIIIGGFRFHNLRGGARKARDISATTQIVVAFSISPLENKEILQMLYDAFNEGDLKLKILLKSHPIMPVSRLVDELSLKLNPNIFEFTDRSLQELVPTADAMIVKESSSVFWGVNTPVPIIVPMLYDTVDLSPLSGLTKLAHKVYDVQELKDIMQRICAKGVSLDIDQYQDFFRKYLEIYMDEKSRYYKNIEEILKA